MTKKEFGKLYHKMETLCVSRYEPRDQTDKRREARMEVFWEAFKHVSAEDFDRGLKWYIEHLDEAAFPLPANLFEAIRSSKPYKTLTAPPEPTAEERRRFDEFIAELDDWMKTWKGSVKG